MKLSEAIRLGAMMKPQCFGDLRNAAGATCALGAAEDAVGIAWTTAWPTHPSYRANCPACGCDKDYGICTPAHLNDDHRWTRERIADWVATFEPQEQSTAVESTPTVDAVDVLAES